MKNRIIFLAVIILSCACQSNQDDQFRKFYAAFQQQVETQPLIRAFLEGKLAFDSILIRVQPADIDSLSNLLNRHFQTMATFSKDQLSPDLHLYQQRTNDFLTVLAKHLELDQVHRTDPAFYDPRKRLNFLLKNGDASAWEATLRTLSTNYQSAEKLLEMATLEQSELALQQSIEVYKILTKEMEKLERVPKPQANLNAQLNNARLATKSFIGLANSLGFEKRDTISIQ